MEKKVTTERLMNTTRGWGGTLFNQKEQRNGGMEKGRKSEGDKNGKTKGRMK